MATVVLKLGNDISTDHIYPGRFMATVLPSETPQFCFADMTEFNARLRNKAVPPGSVIVAGQNFGCGSSREHAPWALLDHGFRAVISTEIADLFRSNSLKNGLLPVIVDEATHAWLIANPAAEIEIDLVASVLRLPERPQLA